MRVLTVCGIKGSGKTTTIELIIRELCRRGYNVGSMKDIHFEGFALDTPGTNTDRHRKAGAQIVVARGNSETDIMIGKKLPLQAILPFFNQDFVVLEGVNEPGIPMILTSHDEKGLESLDNPFVFAVSGKVSGHLSEFKGHPAIDAATDIDRLVSLIEEKAGIFP